jgi:hypothetical protein
MMTVSVFQWWDILRVVAVFNVLAWLFSAALLYRQRANNLLPEVYVIRRLQLVLSAAYVFGCAFRSAFPVYDIPRICLFNSWISTVIVGRSVATVAELCFIVQWAVMLREMSRATESMFGKIVSLSVVPLIVVAEICSWYGVLTTANIGHILEESLWGLCAAGMVAASLLMWPRFDGTLRKMLGICCVGGIAYVAFMFLVDVPMYWSRWIADEANGRHYLSIAQGFLDVSNRWVVSHRWQDWQNEVPWMSLYFSVAVWFSISLIHAPAPKTCIANVVDKIKTAVNTNT